jgi:plasmid maintenance system antidote protein VapI
MKKIEITPRQEELRDKLVALMDRKKLKSSEIARITGRSEGTISELLNSKKVFTDKLLIVIYDSLKDYLGEETLVQTRQFTKMWNVAQSGKKASDMRLVVGNSGIGKSVVFKKFAEQNESCWYIRIDRKELTWNRFLFEVATEMGIRLDRKRKRFPTSYLLDKIIALVEEKADSNPMLIIDESEVARNFFFKEFKNLRTATEGLLNITIVGITDVMTRIGRIAGLECRAYETPSGSANYAWRWYPVRENSNQYTTFARRIAVFRIDNISADDIARFCAEKGITNRKVIDLAAARWWNYDEADRAIRRAERMGINLAEITPQEFEIL